MTYRQWSNKILKDDYTFQKYQEAGLENLLSDWEKLLNEIEDLLYFSWRLNEDQEKIRNIIRREKGEK